MITDINKSEYHNFLTLQRRGFLGGCLADWQIRSRLNLPDENPYRLRINPFSEHTKEPGKLSHGLSSYGYDILLGRKFCLFKPGMTKVIDPLCINPDDFEIFEADQCIIPAGGFCLAQSVEWFRIPEDCQTIVVTKSTYARCAVNMPLTPLEPGWQGIITLEIVNNAPIPSIIHSGQGIGQVLFFEGSAICENPYNLKKGASYQDQKDLTLPRV